MVSLCNQDYRDIEIVLVDDGSPDNSIELATSVLNEKGANYRVHSQENRGLPGARNAGLKIAGGEYVCFIDSDDIVSPTHIADLAKSLDEGDVDVAFSGFEYTKESNRNGQDVTYGHGEIFQKKTFLDGFVKRKPAVHCCSLIIRKSLLERTGLEFNEKLRRYGEDVEFMWRLFSEVDRVGFTGKNTYKYLVRSNSLMTIGKSEPWDNFIVEFTESIERLKSKHTELIPYYTLAFHRTMLGLLRVIAESASRETYIEYVDRIVTDDMLDTLASFPDVKVRVMSHILKTNSILYYLLYRKRIRR
jgi:glycosyltransferase involved in cell wall biosynthesis